MFAPSHSAGRLWESGLKELELGFTWGGSLVFGGLLDREVLENFLSPPPLLSSADPADVCCGALLLSL